MKNKCRIVERKLPTGKTEYVIQQRHRLFRWCWVDAWLNTNYGLPYQSKFDTLEDAMQNVANFDGSKPTETVVFQQK